METLDSLHTFDARLMSMKAKDTAPRSEITLDSDAQKLAEKMMREDGETDWLKFLATVIEQADRNQNQRKSKS